MVKSIDDAAEKVILSLKEYSLDIKSLIVLYPAL